MRFALFAVAVVLAACTLDPAPVPAGDNDEGSPSRGDAAAERSDDSSEDAPTDGIDDPSSEAGNGGAAGASEEDNDDSDNDSGSANAGSPSDDDANSGVTIAGATTAPSAGAPPANEAGATNAGSNEVATNAGMDGAADPPSLDACARDADCLAGNVCTQALECALCEVGSGDTDRGCPAEAPHCVSDDAGAARCVECTSDDDCPHSCTAGGRCVMCEPSTGEGCPRTRPTCVAGALPEDNVCESCAGETRDGSTPCGLNDRGAIVQLCYASGWSDGSTCDDPDVCIDDEARLTSSACGADTSYRIEETCIEGAWSETGCVDPDRCVDGDIRNGTTPCGTNGTYRELCVDEKWVEQGYCTPCTGNITFAEPTVEAYVLEGLGLPSGSKVNALTDAAYFDYFDLSGSGPLETLEDIACFTQLRWLHVDPSPELSDLSPLAGRLKLEWLIVPETSIRDISPLEGLTKLRYFVLTQSPAEELSTLESLTGLRVLNLSRTTVSAGALATIATLPNLEQLILQGSGLTEIGALSGLAQAPYLFALHLSNNQITDISPLAGLTGLETLSLAGNAVQDISALSGYQNLDTLDLQTNAVSDLSPLVGLANLTNLYVGNNPFDCDSAAVVALRSSVDNFNSGCP